MEDTAHAEKCIYYINTKELAKRLSVSEGTIRVWKMNQGMPFHKFRGAIRYNYEDVMHWLQNKE